jgi:hypothetical protein
LVIELAEGMSATRGHVSDELLARFGDKGTLELVHSNCGRPRPGVAVG